MKTTAPTTHLLYLHGFRSSPASMKAQKMEARVKDLYPAVQWWSPQLPPSPAQAMREVMQGVADWPRHTMAVVGSSLGGFYARWVALQTGCRSVLLNPAVFPARDLSKYIGEQTSWHDPSERFFFQAGYVEELLTLQADIESLTPGQPATPERQMAIVAKGDEVLDWREMRAFCLGGTLRLLPGSDHAISDFDDHIDDVLEFLFSSC
ncbi:MAG: YqiA/YcfP family alpha/beta fold hydrolase [Hydrogenophaga sp.]|nr:YqiA/YcfP family alpha/beta fold hydrolase [Hydrogenophaga sp.]